MMSWPAACQSEFVKVNGSEGDVEASLEKQLMFLEAPPKTCSCDLGQAAGPLPSPSPAHSEDMPYLAGLWG